MYFKMYALPVVVQWKQIQLGTMQVQSLALPSGLRIRCCRELWCRSQMWLRSHIAVSVAMAQADSCSLAPIQPPVWELYISYVTKRPVQKVPYYHTAL